ncbi:MAG TPA: 5-methyltetrahydropteroyltriglutamate--homocysteine S-methyltransferase, partial [Nevskia sp.]|nr:5-methyltetrahydropteroyltriglutamate--homocysteine S-methyltransferase [Nevskia sp.]
MTTTHVLGFPRIGARRELKNALESHWKGHTQEDTLRAIGHALRQRHWREQREAGLDYVTVGDFAWYDQVHNHSALFGAMPPRFGNAKAVSLADYFRMARGDASQPALEMTKWFDTNYHYLVPELGRDTVFRLNPEWLLPEVEEARAEGHKVKVVLLGPVSYLYLSKTRGEAFERLSLLPLLLNSYWALLQKLAALGVEWVQLDEPVLCLDLPQAWLDAYLGCYTELASAGPRLLLATYFGSVEAHAPLLKSLPLHGLHLDLVRAPGQLAAFLRDWPEDRVLSAGVVDGRNIWRNQLAHSLDLVRSAHQQLGERLWLAPSCSLLHVPHELSAESTIDPQVREWLAFAREKLRETAVLARALDQGEDAVWRQLQASATAAAARAGSPLTRNPQLRQRMAALSPAEEQRRAPFAARIERQQAVLGLPLYPTTTIGSFPQTAEIRQARARHRAGMLSAEDYAAAMRAEIAHAVSEQESLGLDVLVHGEAERNDMVEYFAELLRGFAVTQNGWVQSYGSRCVKPPILYGDVVRAAPMTVEWTRYAQSLTRKPMKGMLTGPVTLLQWAFVRDDQPRADSALQLALAVRDEVADLEAAGIRVIQIDEPAIREGLPLRRAQWDEYLAWAVRVFRVSSAGVDDATQIHTHMCYSEFNDILPSIAAMDADVITIETSRSDMELLEAFGQFRYPNDIGPGVYDIHSPRVPALDEMSRLLDKAAQVIPPRRLWVNPDCGLKTRGWPETRAALALMVEAARQMRGAA